MGTFADEGGAEMRGIKSAFCLLPILLGVPISIFVGITFFQDRMYYAIAMLILMCSFGAFVMRVELRRPKLREIMLVVVLVGIATAGRAIFFMVPNFKPVAAIVIISGIALNAETGFLIGAMTAFVSNFFYGQGPWTPWQMFAFGMLGFLAGAVFRGKRNEWKENRWILCGFGGMVTLLVYGLIMDTSAAIMASNPVNKNILFAYYVSGFWFNLIHAVSTIVFLLVLGKPMFRRLDRIKRRYGMLRESRTES